MTLKKFIFTLLLFSILSFEGTVYSQTVGKIYSKNEADSLFGKVIESVQIKADQFESIIQQSNIYVMIRVLNGELTVLGDGRNILYPAALSVEPGDVFLLYSKSKVEELLGLSSGSAINIERRLGTTTITSGIYTLEEGWPCPPYCR